VLVPVGQTETFCKHCVAAGLVWLRGIWSGDAATDAVSPPAIDLRAHLLTLDKDALVDLLFEQAENDELFQARLALHAAKASAQPADLEPYRQAIEAAIVVDEYVDYRSMYGYASNVQEVISTLSQLLADGQANEVITLCEYALECVEDALGRVDDSDGQMGDIRDELVELHHEACLLARPDPEQLAERLFDWAVHSEWEIFLDSAARYADVLNERGVARYCALAERVWEHLPAVTNDSADRYGSRFRITYVMESLATLTGSVDDLVAIKARDLAHAYRYVEIIELFSKAKHFAEALAWAERGLAAFPDHTDVRLIDVAARELGRAGRAEEAVQFVWRHLEEVPTAASYELLRRHASAAGSCGPSGELAPLSACRLSRGRLASDVTGRTSVPVPGDSHRSFSTCDPRARSS
jgi:tetratricopeptide (TPR) repeat protein